MNRHGMQTPINVAFKFGQWNRLELLGVKCELSYQRREGRTRVNAFFFFNFMFVLFVFTKFGSNQFRVIFSDYDTVVYKVIIFFFYGKWKVLFNYRLVHITISAALGIQSLVSPRLVRSLIFATVTKLE